jgi:hypothetical protein
MRCRCPLPANRCLNLFAFLGCWHNCALTTAAAVTHLMLQVLQDEVLLLSSGSGILAYRPCGLIPAAL